MQPRNKSKKGQQNRRKSTNYLMLFVLAAIVISTLSIDSQADENDWFVYLGTQEAKKAPRKNINAAEALPHLPLPATPLRRTERKKPSQPDYLVGKVIWGQSAFFADSSGKKLDIADWNLCPTDTEKFVAQTRAMDLQYHWQNTNLNDFHFDPKKPSCPMIIERPDNSAIRPKTKYDRSNLQPSRVFSTAIDHFGLVHEVFLPANKSYSCTS